MFESIKYLNDKEIISILKDSNVVQYRTKEERKKLAEFYNANRSELAYQLILNYNLLYKRSNEEQIELIKKAILVFEEIKNYVNKKVQIVEDSIGVEDFTQFYKANIYKRGKKLFSIYEKKNY